MSARRLTTNCVVWSWWSFTLVFMFVGLSGGCLAFVRGLSGPEPRIMLFALGVFSLFLVFLVLRVFVIVVDCFPPNSSSLSSFRCRLLPLGHFSPWAPPLSDLPIGSFYSSPTKSRPSLLRSGIFPTVRLRVGSSRWTFPVILRLRSRERVSFGRESKSTSSSFFSNASSSIQIFASMRL